MMLSTHRRLGEVEREKIEELEMPSNATLASCCMLTSRVLCLSMQLQEC